MKVLKFGGTSVGSVARMQEVAKLVSGEGQKIVVLSAMSGTTNSLIEISEYLYKNNPSGALERINVLEQQYFTTVDALYSNIKIQKEAREIVASHFNYIRSFSKSVFTLFEEKAILAQGELLSTAMFQLYLQEKGENSALLPALNFMRIDKNAEPDTAYINEHLKKELAQHPNKKIYITQGFICRNFYGAIMCTHFLLS